jgi:diadenylate cyclase
MIDLFKIGFLSISLIDIIDIGIVSILFFFIYRALRGTVAVQVLIIMILLIIASFITEAINLKVVSWIIKTISGVWLIAYIVLFQPEIRRLLMMATRSHFFRLFVKSKISATVDEVVNAVTELSSLHIGALIIFPRSQNVEMTVEKGVELQAVVSKELILSIFNTKSPLHDGAIIIENDLIAFAKSILPLSTATKIGQKILGTRHRAGLGLSEQVDAIVLIVSEETGGISIADEGEITFNIPKDTLRDILIEKLSK